jgi:hypothetical protein
MKKFKIEFQNNSTVWNKFILNSSSPNILNHSYFLNAYNADKFLIKKNQEVFAGFSIIKKNRNEIKIDDDLLYNPIVYRSFQKKNNPSIINEKLEITDLIANFFIKNNFSGEIMFDHFTDDIRSFLWKNFEYKKKLFSVSNIKYTSIINILDLDSENFFNSKFYQNMSVALRQSYKYSINKKKYKIKEYFNGDILSELIKLTFQRQNKEINFDINKHIKILKELNNEKFIKSFVCLDENGNILSKAVFGINGKAGTFLNGARSGLDKDNDYSLVFLLVNSFYNLKNFFITSIDLEGMNSPQRSFFKNGFGGNLKPYYSIKFKFN